jgi:hypothetical protein
MTIAEQIASDVTSAMKKKDELELSTLRLVHSSFKNKRIDLGRELTDEDALAVLKTMKKQFADALSDFEKAGRTDLSDKQKLEIAILDRYLPQQMSAEDLERVVKEAIDAAGITGVSDLGKAMGVAMKAVEGRADGNAVRAIMQRLLTP